MLLRNVSLLSIAAATLACGVQSDADTSPLSTPCHCALGPAAGDFNGDGSSDFLWYHAQTGELRVWLMKGVHLYEEHATLPAKVLDANGNPDLNWTVADVGDFNHDGTPDILWRHRLSFKLVVWFMAPPAGTGMPVTRTTGSFVVPLGAFPDGRWRVAGVADFNDDKKADILWQDDDTAEIRVWTMDYSAGQARQIGELTPAPSAPTDHNWRIQVAGDFDSDVSDAFQPDFVFRNDDSNKLVVWRLAFADDLLTRLSADFTDPDASETAGCRLVAAGQYSEDACSDLVWSCKGPTDKVRRHSAWLMEGNRRLEEVALQPSNGPDGDPAWEIVGPH